MAIQKYEDLNYNQIEVLREIGNIGSGNAATALSSMLGKRISMDVPKTALADFDRAIHLIGDPERLTAGIIVKLSGDIDGMLLHLFEEPFAASVITGMTGKENISLETLDDTDVSVLCEIGNIMSGSYVAAVANLVGMKVDMSVPMLAVDMLGAIMSVPAVELSQTGDTVLVIKENFTIDSVEIKSDLLLIPSAGSLGGLLDRLGAMV
ncbi:MAG: chemotaxis protein CheC [Eubacterium sp.]|nr:chemotaxis protein CheC [Eubacterium sp.]